MSAIGSMTLVVPESAIDVNGHVNNVEYIRWMQEAAMHHSAELGWPQPRYAGRGWTWIVRSHAIEYRQSAYAGDPVTVQTWVADFHRIRSLRRFRFFRTSDAAELARAETLFVFCDLDTGRPLPIPDEVRRCYPVLGPEQEP